MAGGALPLVGSWLQRAPGAPRRWVAGVVTDFGHGARCRHGSRCLGPARFACSATAASSREGRFDEIDMRTGAVGRVNVTGAWSIYRARGLRRDAARRTRRARADRQHGSISAHTPREGLFLLHERNTRSPGSRRPCRSSGGPSIACGQIDIQQCPPPMIDPLDAARGSEGKTPRAMDAADAARSVLTWPGCSSRETCSSWP